MSRRSKSKKVKRVDPNTPLVAILMPSFRAPHPRCQQGINEMVRYTMEQNAAVVFRPHNISSSVVHWTRNQLIATFIKSGEPFTHVLFVDDDIELPKDALVKLLSHKKDIVSAICTRRNDPPIPNARLWDEDRGAYCEMWQWKSGLVEVDSIGTGVMLITLEALQKVADAYFQCRYEQELFGLTEEQIKTVSENRIKAFDKTGDAWWFRFLTPPVGPTKGAGECGEDISFCMVAKRYAGLSIYADTTIEPLHWGDYGYGVNDFYVHRQLAIEKAKADGRFSEKSLPAPENKDSEEIVVVE